MTIKLRKEHIREEWSERSTGDGYWISLRPGLKWAGDPYSAVHCIHEPTKAKAHSEQVMTCDCRDCASEIERLNQTNP